MRRTTMTALPLSVFLLAVAHAQTGTPGAPQQRTMSESAVSLHNLMEPIWQAPKAEAAARACASSGAIQARVDAAVGEKGTGPFLGMSKTANAISGACKEKRMGDVAKLLDDLHRQFHQMVGME